MKIIFLITLLASITTSAAARDCLQEVHDFKLAHKISQMWNSDLDWGKASIAKICKKENPDIEVTLRLDKISYNKVKEEYSSKLTITVEEAGASLDEFADGEVSNDELCVALDKYVKKWADCTSPADYLRSIKIHDYKDYEKICLKNLPEQKKRMIACRK